MPSGSDRESQLNDILDANTLPTLADRGESLPSPQTVTPDLSGIRAIYFDLDDTLCGYWDASKLGLRQAFAAHLPEGRTVEEMVLAWAEAFRSFAPTLKQTGWFPIYLKTGEPTRTEQMRRTLAVLDIVDEARAVALSQAYMEGRDRNLRLFSDAIPVLDALKARFPLGLITNGPADVQRQEIATLGVEKYFDNIYIEGEFGEGKPSRRLFSDAERVVDCQPHEVLMVGNSYAHDIAGALNAGWHAIWIRRASDIPPSATSVESMPEGGPIPDAIVGSLTEVLELLS